MCGARANDDEVVFSCWSGIDPIGRMYVGDELAVVFVLWEHGWKAFGTHGVDRGPEVLANGSLARVEF